MISPEEMAALANDISDIRDSLVLLLEDSDQVFLARTASQKALDLAITTLKDWRTLGVGKKLALKFSFDALVRAHAALQSSGEIEPAIEKIESAMARLAEETL